MDFKNNKRIINNTLIDIENCDNIDKFYELCTKLYFRINQTVWHFEDKILNYERYGDNNVSNN